MHWKDRVGTFRRDLGDGEHAEIVIERRVYLVRIGELGDPQLMSGAVIRRTCPT